MEDLFKQETDARFRDRIGRDHQARVNLQKRREKLKLLDESRRYAQWELSMRRGAQIGKQEHDTRMLRNDKAKLPYNSILIRIYEFRDDKPFPVLTQSLDNFLFFGPTKNCQNLVFFPIEDFSKSILFVDIDFLEFKPLNDFSAIDLMSENDVFKYFESFSLQSQREDLEILNENSFVIEQGVNYQFIQRQGMNLVQATAENFFNKGSQGYQIVPDSFFDHQGNICFLAWSVSDTKITGFENKFRVFKVLFNLENDADLPIEPLSEELTFDGLTKDKKEHQIRYDQEKSRLILIFLTKKDNINEHQQMNLNIQILNLNNYAFEMKNPYKAGTNFKFQQFGEFRPFGTHLIFRKYYDKLLGSYNYYKAIDLKSSNADTGWIRTKNWEKDFEPQYPCFYIDNEVCYTWNQTKEGENKVDYIMHERVNKNPEYGDRIPLLRTYIEFPFMTVLMPCRMRIYDLLVETFTDIIPPQKYEFLQATMFSMKNPKKNLEIFLKKWSQERECIEFIQGNQPVKLFPLDETEETTSLIDLEIEIGECSLNMDHVGVPFPNGLLRNDLINEDTFLMGKKFPRNQNQVYFFQTETTVYWREGDSKKDWESFKSSPVSPQLYLHDYIVYAKDNTLTCFNVSEEENVKYTHNKVIQAFCIQSNYIFIFDSSLSITQLQLIKNAMTMISQDVHFRKNLNLKTINDFFAPNDKFKKILIDQSLIFWAPRLMCQLVKKDKELSMHSIENLPRRLKVSSCTNMNNTYIHYEGEQGEIEYRTTNLNQELPLVYASPNDITWILAFSPQDKWLIIKKACSLILINARGDSQRIRCHTGMQSEIIPSDTGKSFLICLKNNEYIFAQFQKREKWSLETTKLQGQDLIGNILQKEKAVENRNQVSLTDDAILRAVRFEEKLEMISVALKEGTKSQQESRTFDLVPFVREKLKTREIWNKDWFDNLNCTYDLEEKLGQLKYKFAFTQDQFIIQLDDFFLVFEEQEQPPRVVDLGNKLEWSEYDEILFEPYVNEQNNLYIIIALKFKKKNKKCAVVLVWDFHKSMEVNLDSLYKQTWQENKDVEFSIVANSDKRQEPTMVIKFQDKQPYIYDPITKLHDNQFGQLLTIEQMHAGAEYMICNDNFILRKYDYFSFSPSNMYNNQDQKVNVKITETERKEALKLGLEPSLIFFQPKFYQGVNVQKYPELIQDYVDWQFADEYFEKQQKKIETIKDLVLPGLSSVVTPYTYKGSQINLIEYYLKFDTLKLNQVLTILAPFEHNLNLSEKIFTVENIGKLISTGLSGLDDLFEACLVKNEITAERPLYWSKGEKKMVRYLAKDSFSRDKYEHMVEPKKKENKIQKVTQIYSIRIPCLFKPNGVLNFCTALAETSRIETLRITSVKMSIKMIWQIFRWRLLFIAFLPYIAFIVLYSVYLIYYFQKDREEIHTVGWISNIVNLLYGLLQIYIEANQFKLLNSGYWLGPNSIWNYLQAFGYLSAMIFSIMDLFSIRNDDSMYFFGSLSLFLAWFNIFYLMRVIKQTSFFIKMIQEMIIDIAPFMAILFISLLSFTNAFYIMDKAVPENITGGSYSLAFMYSYLTGLGEFAWGDISTDHYKVKYEVYFYILFFLATFFVQIVLLNLLIAIMGDTYDRVMEISEEAYTRELCSMIAEYYKFFPESQFTDNFCIQYLKVEENDMDDMDSWSGKLTNLKIHIDKRLDKIAKNIQGIKDYNKKRKQESKMQVDRLEKNQDRIIKQIFQTNKSLNNKLKSTGSIASGGNIEEIKDQMQAVVEKKLKSVFNEKLVTNMKDQVKITLNRQLSEQGIMLNQLVGEIESLRNQKVGDGSFNMGSQEHNEIIERRKTVDIQFKKMEDEILELKTDVGEIKQQIGAITQMVAQALAQKQ